MMRICFEVGIRIKKFAGDGKSAPPPEAAIEDGTKPSGFQRVGWVSTT